MNVQMLAKVIGVALVLFGVLGFVPALVTDDKLLGIFEVNMVRNVIHIVAGIVAFWAAASAANSRLFFKVLGIVSIGVLLLGFTMEGSVAGLFMVNMADQIFAIVVIIVCLYAGFCMKDRTM